MFFFSSCETQHFVDQLDALIYTLELVWPAFMRYFRFYTAMFFGPGNFLYNLAFRFWITGKSWMGVTFPMHSRSFRHAI